MKKFVAELAKNGRHFKKTVKAGCYEEAREMISEFLSAHSDVEFWDFKEA